MSLYPVYAQFNDDIIQIQLNNDAVNLVNDVFITGTCKNVSNINSSGAVESFGTFSNAATIIGFAEGIILSTGDVRSAVGPNESVETSTQFNKQSLDRDLVQIATDQLFDVTVLEFDFVPVDSEVTFQYVFASEEYCEFVGTNFNDVFGFFVSGPGINGPFSDGAINVATLPNSDEFVSINTVNHNTNQQSYIKNEQRDDIDNCSIDFNPAQLFTLEYDGLTVPLIARIPVIACETYHIRLIVGDVGDDKLDSAVFLRSNSFDLGEVATVKAVVPNQEDPVSYENCLDGTFVFTRPNGSFTSSPLMIDFEIDASSSAVEGIDFSTIPRSIEIPAGQISAVLSIQTLADNEVERAEQLTLKLNSFQSCECKEGDSATLSFQDPEPPRLDLFPGFACTDESFSVVPEVSAGVPPYQYLWDDNSTEMNLLTSIQTETTFRLTVTDLCQTQVIDSVTFQLQETPEAELSGTIDYCLGKQDASLPISFNGQPPWTFQYQIDGGTPVTIDSIFDSAFRLPISEAGEYQLIAFRDAACMGDARGAASVNDINIKLEVDIGSPTCPGAEDGTAILNIEGNPPFEIEWMPLVNNDTNPTDLSAGVYDLSIRDDQNCLLMQSIEIEDPEIISINCWRDLIFIPNAFSPNGDGKNDVFEIFTADQTILPSGFRLDIFDRWGNLIYTAENQLPKWDGRYKGTLLNPGIYMYVISIAVNADQTNYLKGSVTLIR